MTRPKLLDLFCGAGGASAGYAWAGFDVVGVDSDKRALAQYPFPCVLADAMAVLDERPVVEPDALLPPTRGVELSAGGVLDLGQFDAIHASPPCQAYSATKSAHRDRSYPDLLPDVLSVLAYVDQPWVVENVPGAPMPDDAITLCGSEWPLAAKDFDDRELRLRRHRLFASNVPLVRYNDPGPVCRCVEDRRLGRIGGNYGGGQQDRANYPSRQDKALRGGYTPGHAVRCALMGIWWMGPEFLAEAIPPDYTRHLGAQLRPHILEAAS